MRISWTAAWMALALPALAVQAADAPPLEVGFARADLTPDVDGPKPVWIAGYGHNRKATGVHDKLWARAVVIKAGDRKVALVSVDLVGFMYPNTRNVRAKLDGYAYVLVSATHNHEGPDTIGLWGPTERVSGVDPDYLALAESRIVEAVRAAEAGLRPAKAEYGTAEDESLLHDSRQPIVKDGVLRALRFASPDDGKTLGVLVQWNCHPENLGSKNTLITADFPYYTVEALEKAYDAPVAYFTGAVGGLMSAPEDRHPKPGGGFYEEGDYEFARVYGEAVADLARTALKDPEPIRLGPIAVAAKPVALPLHNPLYRLARTIGVLEREAFGWTGSSEDVGPKVESKIATGPIALETEVGYVRLGKLHLAAIPGELYPELVYGRFQEPAEPNADTPDAPLEPAVMPTLPGKKTLLFGLANDEVGYIIPKRQWDEVPPFAYGRTRGQYGEVNSVGPEVAPILLNALKQRVGELSSQP